LNTQPIEKREHRADGQLAVHSIFPTIQGEGPFCGTPCVFIRLAGCNLQCPACDTDYTSRRELMHPDRIAEIVTDLRGPGLVVVTGGEPFRQNLDLLFAKLVRRGYYVQVESNGTLPPTPCIPTLTSLWRYSTAPHKRDGVYVVCSPKTGKLHPDIYRVACALKYVVRHGAVEEDGLPTHALDHTARPARPPEGWDRLIYIQPLDSGNVLDNDFHTAEAVASALKHGYTLQLQIHKIIGVE
jgi:7-carboxy-7-deazaguanine synthase